MGIVHRHGARHLLLHTPGGSIQSATGVGGDCGRGGAGGGGI